VRHHTSKSKYGASGFTLIEVMIALAIFVIGALAIVRIFPPALNVIQGSESRSIAMNRARSYLARSTAQPGLVPDSIYETDLDYVGSMTGTLTRNKALPKGLEESDIQDSALGRFKRIIGERHRLLLDDSVTGSNATDRRFVLSQFSHTATAPASNNVAVYVEDRVTGVRVADDGLLDFTEARLVSDGRAFNQRDYRAKDQDPPNTDPPPADGSTSAQQPTRPPFQWRNEPLPALPRTIYYVTYRWRDTDGGALEDDERVNGVIDERLELPNVGNDDDDFKVLMGKSPTNKVVIEGEVGVRVKRFICNAYIDTTLTDEQLQGDSIRGYIALTDGSSTSSEFASAEDLLLDSSDDDSLGYSDVTLDYTVRDWRWLVDDDTPDPIRSASTEQGSVTTPIRFYDAETLVRLTGSAALKNPQTPLYSLLTFTNDEGLTRHTRFAAGKWNNGQSPEGVLSDVDRKTGEIVYDTNPPVLATPAPVPPTSTFGAPRARTVYWTLDGWAQQVAVAAHSYVPYIDDPDATRERWREYYWEGNHVDKAASLTDDAPRGVLYFPPSESGKSVLVTFEYVDDDGEYRTQSNVVTISDKFDGITGPTTVTKLNKAWPTAVGAQARRAELTKPAGGVYDVRAILAVQGLSIQSRTAWIENYARYTQAEAVGYRKLD
jgi:prepilin-type N-terminal cleavage/methylation domain-containing protein